MKINETVGIDISKKTLDVHIHSKKLSGVFENSKKGFVQMRKWFLTNIDIPKDEVLFVFEHTGIYSEEISDFLSKQGLFYKIVPGLEIKKSLGMVRGKSDRKDAAKIALYGFRLRDEIIPCQIPNRTLRSLKKLLSLRDRLVKQRAGYKASVKEQKRILEHKGDKILIETQLKMIAYLSKQISGIEQELLLIISENGKLSQIFSLVTGIKGVGRQTALYLIAYSEGFTKFKNYRKLASYCGIAPFPNQSGTSIRGRTKVSHLANKKLKSLLDLCAKSAITSNGEMKSYYNRRIDTGKNKMSTINIVRNKLLARIFAVVKRQTPYVDTMKYAA